MANQKVIYGGLVLKGGLSSAPTDRLLTVDATTGEVGYRDAIDLSTLLSTTLAQYRVIVGDSGGEAAVVNSNSVGDVLVDETNGLTIKAGAIVNADVNASAAIAYSKLALTGGIINADVNASAAIAYSKLALTDSVVNADVATAAAIARTKLASGNNYRILANNGSGVMSENAAITASRAVVADANGQLVAQADGTTAAEVGNLLGTTGPIQAQLDDLIATQTVNSVVQSPTSGEDGYAITWDDAAGEYTLTDPVAQGLPTGGTTRQWLGKNSGTNYDASWLDLVLTDITDISALAADLNLLAGADAAGITATEIGYINGVTSPIQTQFASKQSSTLAQNGIWVGNASNLATTLAAGSEGYVLKITSGVPTWAAESIAGTPPGSDTEVVFNDASSFGADSDFTYNKTTNTITVPNITVGTALTVGGAAPYLVGGTDVAVADGGTGLSAIAALSILVANSANTYVALTPSAGQSIRMNAGGTAWEAYLGGSGDVTKVGTPVNSQIGVWTGDGTIEGDTNLQYDGTDLILGASKGLKSGAIQILSDAAGVMTMSNIDVLDATTQNTVAGAKLQSTSTRYKYSFVAVDTAATSGNVDLNLFTTEEDLQINVKVEVIGIKSDGSQGYYGEKSATFRKDGSATATQVGTTTTLVEHKDDGESSSISMNSTNVRITYNSGDADSYRWTVFVMVTRTMLT